MKEGFESRIHFF